MVATEAVAGEEGGSQRKSPASGRQHLGRAARGVPAVVARAAKAIGGHIHAGRVDGNTPGPQEGRATRGGSATHVACPAPCAAGAALAPRVELKGTKDRPAPPTP